MPAAVAERQAFLWCYLALRMGLIEVVTGILPHLVTESNNNLCLWGGALNDGIDRNALERNTETGLLHAGKLNFRTLPASVLRHLPMVKKDYPELFE